LHVGEKENAAVVEDHRQDEPVDPDIAKKKPSKRKKGAGSKSGPLNRQKKGGSDEEIQELKPAQIKKAADNIKEQWTDDEKTLVVKYITSEKVWKDFCTSKAKDFIHVSVQLSGEARFLTKFF
jgi:hypothetical protein